MGAPAERYDELSREDIESALTHINPELLDREEWLRVGRALWSEFGDTVGGDMWRAWSEGATWYKAKETAQQWKSINSKGSRIKIGTLLHMAMAGGWDFAATKRRQLTPQELAQRQAERDARDKLSRELEKQRRGAAAKLANELWADAVEADAAGHPYLTRKGVPAYGLRLGRWPLWNKEGTEVWQWVDNVLLVPRLNRQGKLRSLQGIFPARREGWESDKAYLKGGELVGTFHMIGAPKLGDPVLVCEGYATGATLHRATGWAVAVAFDAGNLLPVAEGLAEILPEGQAMVIAGDNDQWTRSGNIENPGAHYARTAADSLHCRHILPQFTPELIAEWRTLTGNTEGGPTDWNDLEELAGQGEVSRQVLAMRSTKAANDPAPPQAANDPSAGGALEPVATRPDVDIYDLPDQGRKGAVLSTIRNLAEICNRLGIVIRYNAITKREEILIPYRPIGLDNYHNVSLQWLKDECVHFRMPTAELEGKVLALADMNHYNPAAVWVSSRPWDGRSRLREFYDTLTLKDPAKGWLRDALVKRWMLTAIAGAFNPSGVTAQGMLVLQGEQDAGKTQWFLSLTPPELNLAKDGQALNPDDRDSVKQATMFWLVELGEIDNTFRQADVAALKAFITRGSDLYRSAYAKTESQYPRRTAFFGSVNPQEFLRDATGNRRFWTLQVQRCDFIHAHLDMQQVWAEFLHLWQNGESHLLTQEEKDALRVSNEDFTTTDPLEEQLQTKLRWNDDPADWVWRTVTDTLLSIGYDKLTQSECTKAAPVIRRLNGGQVKKSAGRRLVLVPRAYGPNRL